MNNALWYIYLTDISTNVSSIIFALGILAFIFLFLFCCIEEITLKKVVLCLIPGVICFLIFIFIPSKTTLYMMAASEIKEDSEMSETNKKVIDLINMKLDEALKEKNK